eukprot:5189511-Amphidinium_carterae.1
MVAELAAHGRCSAASQQRRQVQGECRRLSDKDRRARTASTTAATDVPATAPRTASTRPRMEEELRDLRQPDGEIGA